MNRADFLKRLGLGAIGVAVAPMLMAKTENETQPAFNGMLIDKRILEIKNIHYDTRYDFTNEEYAIKNNRGFIVGWRDLSGNNNHCIFKGNE